MLGERICRQVEALGLAHGAQGAGAVVTVSVGGASTMPVRGGHGNDLLAAADEALYRAKHEGKNRAILREIGARQEPTTDA